MNNFGTETMKDIHRTYIGRSPARQGVQTIQVECLAVRHAQENGSENSVELLACDTQKEKKCPSACGYFTSVWVVNAVVFFSFARGLLTGGFISVPLAATAKTRPTFLPL